MIWRNNLWKENQKENQGLKQQLESVQAERNQLRKLLQETREELARVRLDYQDQIDDLQDHVENLKTFIEKSTATKDVNNNKGRRQIGSKNSSVSSSQLSPKSVTKTHHQQQLQQQSELSTYLVGFPNNERIMKEAELAEMTIMGNIYRGSVNNSHHTDLLLRFIRRMMAMNLMRRWMTTTIQKSSSSELDLYESTSRLLLNMFGLERCSYSYYLDDIDGTENSLTCVTTNCTITREHGFFINSEQNVPLDGTAIEHMLKTKQSYIYYPRSSRSPFSDHAMISAMGYETVLNIPIYHDNADSLYATLTITVADSDSLNAYDRFILTEIAKMHGDNVSLLRFQSSRRDIQQLSQYLLYSHCPEPIMKKLQNYWDNGGVYTESDLTAGYTNQSLLNNDPTMKMISTITTPTHDTNVPTATDPSLLSNTLVVEQHHHQQQHDCDISTSHLRALYAYGVYDVCIVYADIENLSQLNATMSPLDVMDVLQQLVSKFDILYKKHRILKVESSVGSFVGASGIIEDSTDFNGGDDDDDGSSNDENDFLEYLAATSPQRALAFAKDLILAANTVSIINDNPADEENIDTVSLRVGIHWGDSTCGILRAKSSLGGLLLDHQQQHEIPKFTLLGPTIDVASKIEKSCPTNTVVVSDDFFHLVESDDVDVDSWDGPHIVPLHDSETAVPCWHCNPYFEK